MYVRLSWTFKNSLVFETTKTVKELMLIKEKDQR